MKYSTLILLIFLIGCCVCGCSTGRLTNLDDPPGSERYSKFCETGEVVWYTLGDAFPKHPQPEPGAAASPTPKTKP